MTNVKRDRLSRNRLLSQFREEDKLENLSHRRHSATSFLSGGEFSNLPVPPSSKRTSWKTYPTDKTSGVFHHTAGKGISHASEV